MKIDKTQDNRKSNIISIKDKIEDKKAKEKERIVEEIIKRAKKLDW